MGYHRTYSPFVIDWNGGIGTKIVESHFLPFRDDADDQDIPEGSEQMFAQTLSHIALSFPTDPSEVPNGLDPRVPFQMALLKKMQPKIERALQELRKTGAEIPTRFLMALLDEASRLLYSQPYRTTETKTKRLLEQLFALNAENQKIEAELQETLAKIEALQEPLRTGVAACSKYVLDPRGRIAHNPKNYSGYSKKTPAQKLMAEIAALQKEIAAEEAIAARLKAKDAETTSKLQELPDLGAGGIGHDDLTNMFKPLPKTPKMDTPPVLASVLQRACSADAKSLSAPVLPLPTYVAQAVR
jgi:hypothetical protein